MSRPPAQYFTVTNIVPLGDKTMTSVAGREGGARTGEGEERKSYKLSLLGLLIVASCALHSVMEWNGIILVIQSRWELVSV